MSFFEGFILGAVQGITEFLPISSSGHLVAIREFLGFGTEYDLSIDAVLQLATALAVLVYFRKELLSLVKIALSSIFNSSSVSQKEKNFLLTIILGTIPAIIIGLLFESKMETVFRNANLVAGTLIFGSILMFFAEKFHKKTQNNEEGFSGITLKNGFMIGVFQALAVVPGVSRSGATISGGLFSGLSRLEATRFSFILSFPIIAGSGLKKFFELYSDGIIYSLSFPLLLSFAVSFFVGISIMHLLILFLKNHSLNVFIVYRIILAIGILIFI